MRVYEAARGKWYVLAGASEVAGPFPLRALAQDYITQRLN